VRRLVYQALIADTTLMGLLPGGLAGDRVEGVPDTLPFGVLTFEGPTPGVGKHRTWRCTFWAHGESQDYTDIDQVLLRVKTVMAGLAPSTLNGIWLTDVQWEGDSPDLHDEDRGTNVRTSAFLLAGSGL